MATNIEWKAHARQFARQRGIAESLAGREAELLIQRDTFFRVPSGRLKLRELSPTEGDLIYYHRTDHAGARASHFQAAKTRWPGEWRRFYAERLGVIGDVRKRRWLSLIGDTRIHLDEVEDLGTFLEVEVVLVDGMNADEGLTLAHRIQRELEVKDEDIIDVAYIDLLALRQQRPPAT